MGENKLLQLQKESMERYKKKSNLLIDIIDTKNEPDIIKDIIDKADLRFKKDWSEAIKEMVTASKKSKITTVVIESKKDIHYYRRLVLRNFKFYEYKK